MRHVAYHLSEVDEPSTIQEAKSGDHAAEWKMATDAEYNSLIENKTCKLVELPPGRKAIGCKWVFKLKHDVDGRVERFKAVTPRNMALIMMKFFRLWFVSLQSVFC